MSNRTSLTPSFHAKLNKPVLPRSERKHLIIEDKSQLVVIGKTGNALKEAVQKDWVIDNLTSYFSLKSQNHVTIIFYYE